MRRTLSLCAVLVLSISIFAPGHARADSIINLALEIIGDQLETTQSITGDADVWLDLSGTPASFFANNYAVLDASITYDLGSVFNPSCPPNLTLYQSDAARTLGARVRRSAAPKINNQRDAIGQPSLRYYLLRVRRATTGDVSTAGPCAIVNTVSYTLRTRLYASAPVATGLGFAPIHMPTTGDGEPSIAVDRTNGDRVYISAPVGIPAAAGGNTGGVDFWRSLDRGTTWSYAQKGNPLGGGDSHVAVTRNGDVFLADLGGAAVYVSKSTDAGATFVDATPAGANSDRQWLATYTPPGAPAGAEPTKVFIDYHDLGPDNLPYECISLSGGTVFQPVCNPMATRADTIANATGNTIIGNQLFDSHGTIYGVFTSPNQTEVPPDTSMSMRYLWLAVSTDGVLFANQVIATAPLGYDMGGLFPVIAIDKSDNLYVVWSERRAPAGTSVIKLAFSRDHGTTWSAPRTISTLGQSALLPWIVAGNTGQVDITWVGSTNGSANDPAANWYQYMAQSTDVLGGGAFTTVAMSPQPIRYGNVCLLGLLCSTEGDDGRILLDFTSIDRDSQCNAHATYANGGPEGRAGAPGAPYTDYARQNSGRNICQPVTPPPPPCDVNNQADGQGEIADQGRSNGTFSFRACGTDGEKEHADYSDADKRVSFHSTSYRSVTHNVATHAVTISGTGVNGDHLVTFTITAIDNGLTGATDVFAITLSDGYARRGALANGNIVLK
jgi:hypothetical protein